VNPAANACTGLVAVSTGSPQWTVILSSSSSVGATAYSQIQVLAPTAPASTSYTMQGMAASITPTSTGRVHVQYAANLTCGTLTAAGDGIYLQFYYGTSTAPTNGTSATGTLVQVSSQDVAIQYLIPTTVTSGQVSVPVSRDFFVSGLTVGTAYWVDAGAKYVAAAGCQATGAMITIQEF
jgi:hypothetical protein